MSYRTTAKMKLILSASLPDIVVRSFGLTRGWQRKKGGNELPPTAPVQFLLMRAQFSDHPQVPTCDFTNMPFESPLKGYENAEPLPDRVNEDGKSLYNPPAPKSASYEQYPPPFSPNKNVFDFHIYYREQDPEETKYARELHERIRREFPELRIYKFWDKPVGPHPTAMFEVNTFTPHETGTLFGWLVVNRGPCSVLVHPNTGDALRDHSELPAWIGKPLPLKIDFLKSRLGPA